MTDKRNVLITGCSDGGTGAALALMFHQRGDFRVIATARDVGKMASLKVSGIELVALDIQSQESIKRCVETTSALLNGKLDMLINNAGAGYSMPLMDVQLDNMRQVFETNVFSLVSVTQAFLPLLQASREAIIVNHTSVSYHYGIPMQSVYNSSKAAAAMLTTNLRQELAAFGIKVVDLKSGAIETNFHVNLPGAGGEILPKSSIYATGRDAIERGLNGESLGKGRQLADAWAAEVVADLTGKRTPKEIWRGTRAWWLRLLTWLPVSLADSAMKNMSGLDVFEKNYMAQKKEIKIA